MMGIPVIKSMIEHKSQGMEMFSTVQFGGRIWIAYYSNTLIYMNPYGDKD